EQSLHGCERQLEHDAHRYVAQVVRCPERRHACCIDGSTRTSPHFSAAELELLRQLLAVDLLDAFLRHADDDVTETGKQVSRGDAGRLQIALLVQRGVQRQYAALVLGDEDDLLIEVHLWNLLRDLPCLDELLEVPGVGNDPVLRQLLGQFYVVHRALPGVRRLERWRVGRGRAYGQDHHSCQGKPFVQQHFWISSN